MGVFFFFTEQEQKGKLPGSVIVLLKMSGSSSLMFPWPLIHGHLEDDCSLSVRKEELQKVKRVYVN